MGHTFTYYAFLIKLTKSQEKSNIKLSAGRDKKTRVLTITVRLDESLLLKYKSLEHNFPLLINFTWPTLLPALLDLFAVIKRFL